MKRDRIEILEVGPRDGLQSEAKLVSTASKVEFIHRALAAGVRRIEVASFVNPKRVPQMADAEDVLKALPRRDDVTYVGLVLNHRGLERALGAGCSEIGMAVVASDTFSRRNQGMGYEEAIAAWLDIAGAATRAGIRAQVTISAAFGCPYEGEVPLERVVEIARRVADAKPTEIALADTIGVAVPTQVVEALQRVHQAVPEIPLRCHFHDTRNTGLANAYAAVTAGVRRFDSSLGGIGGCPFAPGATGNVPTEDLLYMFDRCGYETGIDLDAAIDTGRWLQQQLGLAVTSRLVRAGPFPRIH